MEQELEKISGTVEDVTYHNEESGFTVLLVDVDGDPVTVVGEVPEIAEGEEITATGNYKVHGTYGVQFRAELIERTLPATAGAIRKYLSSGAVKGLGPALAGRIVARFGDDTLTIIEKEPERLTEVRGISAEKARKIGEEYQRQFGIRSVMSLLASLGLPAATAIKAWRRWGANTADVLKSDPYALCCEEIGVEFEEADRMAAHFGVAGEDPCRLGAGLQYILRVNSRSGHTCLPKGKLLSLATEFLQAAPEGLENTLATLIEDNTLAAYAVGEKEYIYLQPLYRAESYVASRVCIALQLQPPRLEPMEDELDELEQAQGITYDPVQRRAIAEAVQSRLFILTGGPGTGKTTTLRGILALLEQRGEKVALAAPTGRAAKRMAEITGREASTIHRLLEVEPKTEVLTFKRGEKNPLPADAVIVDEMSMVDTLLMEHLLRGMRLGARLIMVGGQRPTAFRFRRQCSAGSYPKRAGALYSSGAGIPPGGGKSDRYQRSRHCTGRDAGPWLPYWGFLLPGAAGCLCPAAAGGGSCQPPPAKKLWIRSAAGYPGHYPGQAGPAGHPGIESPFARKTESARTRQRRSHPDGPHAAGGR